MAGEGVSRLGQISCRVLERAVGVQGAVNLGLQPVAVLRGCSLPDGACAGLMSG